MDDRYYTARRWVRDRNDDLLEFFYRWLVPVKEKGYLDYDDDWIKGIGLILAACSLVPLAPVIIVGLICLFVAVLLSDIWRDNVHEGKYPGWVARRLKPLCTRIFKFRLKRRDRAAWLLLKMVEEDLAAWRKGQRGPYRWANFVHDLRKIAVCLLTKTISTLRLLSRCRKLPSMILRLSLFRS